MVLSAIQNFFRVKPKTGKKNKLKPACSFEMQQTSATSNCSQQSQCFVPEPRRWFFKKSDPVIKKSDKVFLSFRGEELRVSFVSHVEEALKRNGINVIIDKDEVRGTDLQDLSLRIKEAKIGLVIFSPGYSESKWCLDEAVEMKKRVDKRKLIVIPVFYKVKVRDVNNPTEDSEFGRNFSKLKETYSRNQIKKWENTLECISGKMGICLKDVSCEAQLVRKIVEAVKEVIEARRRKSIWKKHVVDKILGYVHIGSSSLPGREFNSH